MSTRLLVFDLDGTLIDTMGDYADKAAALICDHHGTPKAEARRRYFETSGVPFEQQLEQMFPGAPCNTKVAQMFEGWKDGYLANVTLSSETEQLLRGWRNAGYRIAISSNNLEPYVQRLARCWPVDVALGYRPQDGFSKGESHFQKLEEHFGFPRQQMLFIGDSLNDARIATQSKVPFLALLTREFAEADFIQYSPGVKCIAQLRGLNASLHDGGDTVGMAVLDKLQSADNVQPPNCRAKNRIRAFIARSEVPEDPCHADNTLEWLLRLEPDAGEALQLAALAHDIDRAIERIKVRQVDFDNYDAFKAAHAQNSAEILRPILTACGVERNIVKEVCRLVEFHEVGGDPDSDLLKDADSISYFDVNLPLYFQREGWSETKRRSHWGYRRLTPRAQEIVKHIVHEDKDLARLLQEVIHESVS